LHDQEDDCAAAPLHPRYRKDPRGHRWGTEQIVTHIERRWCPTLSAACLSFRHSTDLTFNPLPMSTIATAPSRNRTNLWLWIVQGLLALVFLFSGGSKLAMPADVLATQSHLPGMFMKFIGVCEVLGAVGLIVPGLTHIRPSLTPLAAALLVIIMIGATVNTALYMPAVLPVPIVVLLLSAYVAYGRWRLAPLNGSSGNTTAGARR